MKKIILDEMRRNLNFDTGVDILYFSTWTLCEAKHCWSNIIWYKCFRKQFFIENIMWFKFFDSMYLILMPKLTFSSNLFQVFYQCWTWSKSSFEKVKLYKSIESIFARKIIIIIFVSVQHVTCIEIAKVKLCFNGIKIIILNNNRNTKTQHNFH